MSVHMLAVFGAETARPPVGLAERSTHATSNAEALCQDLLSTNFASCKPSSRKMVTPGKGCGFSFEPSPFCSYASRNGVHLLMTGEVGQWPGLDAVSAGHNAFVGNQDPPERDDAHYLLDFYSSFIDPGMEAEAEGGQGLHPTTMDKALDCLAQIQGSFAFVIFDSVRHRVLAGRDREGVMPLYWGATDAGQLMFGGLASDLVACNPTATLFPAGCLFNSGRSVLAFSPGSYGWVIEGDDVPGEVLSFVAADDAAHFRGVKAIPRITSQGMVCGAVYKVASKADMAHPMLTHH